MRKKKIFLGGYINQMNAQNINCKSIAHHLDKDKYIVKTLVLGSENIPNITGVTYIRVYTFLYAISNLIAFIRAVFWSDVCYVPKHQSTPKFALKIARFFGTKIFTTIEGNMCDTSVKSMIDSFGSIEKMNNYFKYIVNIFGITKHLIQNSTCGVNLNNKPLVLGVEHKELNFNYPRTSLKNIIFIGSLIKRKRVDEIIKLAVIYPNITFHIVGDGALRNDLRSQATINVIFHGKISHNDIGSFLQDMDLNILLSKSEGFPKVILECASASVPSLLYDNYGASDWIETDKNGFVLQSFEEVKDKLSEILNNSKLIEDTSKGAYQMSLKYDWEKVINQWEQVIEELI